MYFCDVFLNLSEFKSLVAGSPHDIDCHQEKGVCSLVSKGFLVRSWEQQLIQSAFTALDNVSVWRQVGSSSAGCTLPRNEQSKDRSQLEASFLEVTAVTHCHSVYLLAGCVPGLDRGTNSEPHCWRLQLWVILMMVSSKEPSKQLWCLKWDSMPCCHASVFKCRYISVLGAVAFRSPHGLTGGGLLGFLWGWYVACEVSSRMWHLTALASA